MSERKIKLIPFVLTSLFCLLTGGKVFAVIDPSYDGPKVSTITVTVESEPRIVRNGETISVAKGDLLRIDSVETGLTMPQKTKLTVNIIGFNGGANDFRKDVRTSKDLIKKWSVQGDGKLYRTKILAGTRQIGELFIEIIEPQLRYVIAEVNGVERILYPKSRVLLDSKDKIKVKRIATNVSESDEQAKFQLRPLMGPNGIDGMDFFQLQISREGQKLSGITIVINEK